MEQPLLAHLPAAQQYQRFPANLLYLVPAQLKPQHLVVRHKLLLAQRSPVRRLKLQAAQALQRIRPKLLVHRAVPASLRNQASVACLQSAARQHQQNQQFPAIRPKLPTAQRVLALHAQLQVRQAFPAIRLKPRSAQAIQARLHKLPRPTLPHLRR